MDGFIPAFIEVGCHFSVKLKVRKEQPEKRQGNLIEYFPAVPCSVPVNIEIFSGIRPYDLDSVRLTWSELDGKASVRVDFEIEIVWRVNDHKEELKAAVFKYRGQRFGVFGANIFFNRTEMDEKRVIGIA